MNPDVQTVENVYCKGGLRVSKAKLRPAEVDHILEVEKNTLGGVAFNLSAAIFRT